MWYNVFHILRTSDLLRIALNHKWTCFSAQVNKPLRYYAKKLNLFMWSEYQKDIRLLFLLPVVRAAVLGLFSGK